MITDPFAQATGLVLNNACVRRSHALRHPATWKFFLCLTALCGYMCSIRVASNGFIMPLSQSHPRSRYSQLRRTRMLRSFWDNKNMGASAIRTVVPRRAMDADWNRELVAWIRDNGGVVSDAMKMAVVEGKGGAVICQHPISASEQLLVVPGELDLSWSMKTQSMHALPPLFHELSENFSWKVRLAVHIAVELERLEKDVESNNLFDPFWKTLDLEDHIGHLSHISRQEDWQLLRGTAEFYRPLELQRLSNLVASLNNVSDLQGGISNQINETKFILATNFVSTHGFSGQGEEHHIFPLAINFNHDVSSCANAKWKWDDQKGAFYIWASRDIEAGEEITITYGPKSNAQLFSTYGFTLQPDSEPVFTYRATDFVAASLQSSFQGVSQNLQLTTLPHAGCESEILATSEAIRDLTDAADLRRRAALVGRSEAASQLFSPFLEFMADLRGSLHVVASAGLSPEEFLTQFVKVSAESYKDDSSISSLIWQFHERRARLPRCWAWWTPQGTDLGDASSPVNVGSRWLSDVVRLKMSEYLCLMVYKEALALRQGHVSTREVLPQAVALLPLLEVILSEHAPVDD